MTKNFDNLSEKLRSIRFNPYPEINADVMERIQAGSQIRVCMTKPEYDLWLRVEQTFGNIAGLLDELVYYVNSYGGVGVAYQELTIAAGDLTTTEVANDTVITTGLPRPFVWTDPRLDAGKSIVLEPASGVQPMAFVWSRKAFVNPAVMHIVDPDTQAVTHGFQIDCVNPVHAQPTYLQRLQWQTVGGKWKLYAKPWTVGQILHMTQLIVVEGTVLTP